jgi:hypothetical protein
MANEIGVKVEFDVVLNLCEGKFVKAEAHFPNYGAQNGTLIFHRYDDYIDFIDEICKLEYTCSQFGGKDDEWCDPDSLREILADWGQWQ